MFNSPTIFLLVAACASMANASDLKYCYFSDATCNGAPDVDSCKSTQGLTELIFRTEYPDATYGTCDSDGCFEITDISGDCGALEGDASGCMSSGFDSSYTMTCDTSLTTAAIVGIVIGVLCCCGCCGFLGWFLFMRNNK